MPATDLTAALSPKQLRSIAEADARINVWHGSIRSGKTIGSLIRWLIYLADPPTGGRYLMVGKTLQTIERNVIEPLQDEALFGPLARLVRHTPGASTAIILGKVVHLVGANDARSEEKLRGVTCAGAYVDEVTVLPEQFWNQLLGRCSVPGAKVFATTNPDSPGHWFLKKFLLRAGELDLRDWRFGLADNPSLTDEYVAAISAEYVGLWYRRFILGEWVAAEGAIYDMWDPARHVIGGVDDDLALPDGETPTRWWIGVDYGTTNPFAAILATTTDRGRVVAVDEWRWDPTKERQSLTDTEFSERMRRWLDARRMAWGAAPDWVFVDPSAASFKVQLWRDEVEGIRDADNDVIDGIRVVASALASGRHVVHARCAGLIEEFPGYVWDPKATLKGEDRPMKTADHSLDADRYAVKSGHWMWRNEPLLAAA